MGAAERLPGEAEGKHPVPGGGPFPQPGTGSTGTGNKGRPCLFSDSLLVLSITSVTKVNSDTQLQVKTCKII